MSLASRRDAKIAERSKNMVRNKGNLPPKTETKTSNRRGRRVHRGNQEQGESKRRNYVSLAS